MITSILLTLVTILFGALLGAYSWQTLIGSPHFTSGSATWNARSAASSPATTFRPATRRRGGIVFCVTCFGCGAMGVRDDDPSLVGHLHERGQ